MKRYTLLLILAFGMFTASAQQSDSVKDSASVVGEWPAPFPALTLLVSPLAPLDPNTSTLLFGVEYRDSARIGVAVEYGAAFRPLQITSLGLTDNKNDFRYFKAKAEVRYYMLPQAKHPHQDVYIALQGFYIPQTYTRYQSNYIRNNTRIGYDRAVVDKKVAGLAVNLGFIWYYKHNWQLEVGGGLGVRYVAVDYQTYNEYVEYNGNNSQINMFNQSEKPGSTPDFHVSMVCRVGYRINLSGKRK